MWNFRILVPVLMAALFAQPASAIDLPNGSSVSGTLAFPGALQNYTFTASAGDSVSIRMADVENSNLRPYLFLYSPDGELLRSNSSFTVARITNERLTASGTYRVQVQDFTDTGTGNFELHLAVAPGADEGGRLVDDDMRSEQLSAGDLDTFTFAANAGDTFFLSMSDATTEGELRPYLLVYSPDGSLLDTDQSFTAAVLNNIEAPQAGVYTVVATDFTDDLVSGDYILSFQLIRANSSDDCLVADARNQYTLADNEYALLSLPCRPPSGTTLQSLFGDDIDGVYDVDWAVFTYDSTATPSPRYVQVPANGSLEPGQGFWIIQSTLQEVVLDMPAGSQRVEPDSIPGITCVGADGCRTISLSGAAHPLSDEDGQPIRILWNLIGNPASGTESGTSGADVRISTADGVCIASDGGCDLEASNTVDITSNVMFTYDGSTPYQTLGVGAELEAWQGYWIAELPGAVGNEPKVIFPAN